MYTLGHPQRDKRSVGGRNRSLIIRSFLPFAARFFWRHPTKLAKLRQYWTDYTARYGKIALLTGKAVEDVQEVFYYLEYQEPHLQEIVRLRGGADMNHVVCYALVRLMQPDVVVETGVHEGWSSWLTLLALEQNGRGTLHSIDLPNQDIELFPGGPRQCERIPSEKQPGWAVPMSLRARWQLHIGDAKDLLPRLLPTLGPIDIFVHDSLHTYEHMMFEFRTVWPWLREGGLIVADDIDLHSAFPDFAAHVQCPYVRFTFMPSANNVGAMRKAGQAEVAD